MHNFKKIVGLSINEAKTILQKEGYTIRVVDPNGKIAMTCDYRIDRVNVLVEDEIVSKLLNIG